MYTQISKKILRFTLGIFAVCCLALFFGSDITVNERKVTMKGRDRRRRAMLAHHPERVLAKALRHRLRVERLAKQN
jgi:hypothetical protein